MVLAVQIDINPSITFKIVTPNKSRNKYPKDIGLIVHLYIKHHLNKSRGHRSVSGDGSLVMITLRDFISGHQSQYFA